MYKKKEKMVAAKYLHLVAGWVVKTYYPLCVKFCIAVDEQLSRTLYKIINMATV
jgi:hypothetical protein